MSGGSKNVGSQVRQGRWCRTDGTAPTSRYYPTTSLTHHNCVQVCTSAPTNPTAVSLSLCRTQPCVALPRSSVYTPSKKPDDNRTLPHGVFTADQLNWTPVLQPINFVTLTLVTNNASCNWVNLVQVSSVQFARCGPPSMIHCYGSLPVDITSIHDTIRDAILTCARKPTWVSLIYRTSRMTEFCCSRFPDTQKILAVF